MFIINNFNVAAKLAEGVTLQKILDDIRESIHTEELERLHLITRTDLHNIKRDFKLNDTQHHSSDDVSVSVWLAKMKDCVLLHKKVGDDLDNLDSKDRVIVLMTELQCGLLQKFGTNIVCVDTTYSTNVQNLLVTTLLVLDEFGSGIPVAFCVSNRESIAVMTHFFSAVKDRAGGIHAKVFMSDDTVVFRRAWSNVMGLAENNILCTWHVDRSWRNNLKKINGENKKALVYKALRMLLEEVDIDKFNGLLESFETDLREDSDTTAFGIYFTEHYGYRPHHWAYCHRRKLGINTNMHLEAMHRVLKYCYLDGKRNNRLDKLLVVLMKLVRDKMFDRIVKLYKGGNSRRIKLIQARHKASEGIDRSYITVNEDNETQFKVKSSNDEVQYTVLLNGLDCELKCQLVCGVCHICVHTFSCSCPDSLIKLNICKHIHAVSAKYSLHSSANMEQLETVTEESSLILSSLKKEDDEDEDTELQRDTLAELQALATRVNSSKLSKETLCFIKQNVRGLLQRSNSEYFKDVPRANNEKVKVQQATMKNTPRKSICAKPSVCEKENVSDAKRQPDSVSVLSDHTYCQE